MSRVYDFESSSCSIFETPISGDLLAKKCDTCRKSFSHSSSYRRHISEELDSEEDGISTLSNASFADNTGKLFTSSNIYYFGRV